MATPDPAVAVTELLAGFPIGGLGAGALVTLIVLSILRGNLVPRQQLIDKQADCDAWRTSATDWQKTAMELGMTLEKLVVLAETTNHALTEIQKIGAHSPDQERSG